MLNNYSLKKYIYNTAFYKQLAYLHDRFILVKKVRRKKIGTKVTLKKTVERITFFIIGVTK